MVVQFSKGCDFDDYINNLLLKSAIERQIQIVGEATYNLTADLKKEHPQIEWKKMEGSRHILVHEYDEVMDSVLWGIVTKHIPQLLIDIEPIIESLGPIE